MSSDTPQYYDARTGAKLDPWKRIAELSKELAAVTAERDDLRENGQRLMEVADGWKAEAQRVTAERDALKKDLADAHGIAQACELRAERAEAECAALRKKHGN